MADLAIDVSRAGLPELWQRAKTQYCRVYGRPVTVHLDPLTQLLADPPMIIDRVKDVAWHLCKTLQSYTRRS